MATATSRIPLALQKIFMASNQGEEVHDAPQEAYRVYRRKNGNNEQVKPVFAKYSSPNRFKRTMTSVPPQARFHLMLKERQYSPRNYASKRSAYYNKPTEHQLSSYGSEILAVVKGNQVEGFRRMMEAGLSPNACNQHGESLLHMVCRHGKVDLFKILVAYDVDIQQTDDYGRTAMHDACWASNPSFEVVNWLINRDPALLFLFDARGSLPLSYVTKSLWADYNEFLEDHIDKLFPRDNKGKDESPLLCTLKPDTRPVPDPKNKIPASMASMIANGTMTACAAIMKMREYEDDASTVMSSAYGSDDDDDDSSYDSDSDFDSDEEEELYEIVGNVGNMNLQSIGE